jgi:23S rRNA (uridine2552-2'-O)-methyltransferase
MAPKTIGIKVTDEARSLELVRMAMRTAEATLKRGGALVAKVFMGGDFPELRREFSLLFDEVHVIRPEATRDSSYEVYILGKRFKGAPSRPETPERPSSREPPPEARAARTKATGSPARPRAAAPRPTGGKARRRP